MSGLPHTCVFVKEGGSALIDPLFREAAMLRAYTTDELGLVKVVEAPSLQQIDVARVVQTWGEPSRATAISSLSAGDCTHVAVARAGGIDLLSPVNGAVQSFLPAVGQDDRDQAGISLLTNIGSDPSLLSCSRSGLLRLHAIRREEPSGAQCSLQQQCSWQAAANVEGMAVHRGDSATSIALACHGSELSIWDLEQRQKQYQAKGNKPNRIGLVDKPWNTAVAFLPGSDGQKVAVGTAYHKLRIYDVKSRRPALDMQFGEAKITALAPQRNGTRVWAADSMGKIECLDLRMNKLQGSLKGPAGAVKSLALHPELPIIASVGLDRFFRVHNIDSKALLCKLYLKQQLTAVAWSPEMPAAETTAVEDGTAQAADTVEANLLNPLEEVSNAAPVGRTHSKRSSSHKKGKSHKKKQKLQ